MSAFHAVNARTAFDAYRSVDAAANKARIPLAKMAVEETGMGIVEDKVIKNNYDFEYR